MTQGSPVEIERKFLLATLPDLRPLTAVEVRQGYLTAEQDSVELRLRQKGAAWFLTLKSGAGLRRTEHEIVIEEAQFTALWPATRARRIEKTRYLGQLDDGTGFELDIFSGKLAPLTLIEVEFPSLDAARAFAPPTWFGREVTEDPRFKNKALATADRSPAAQPGDTPAPNPPE